MEKFNTLALGTAGTAGVEVANNIDLSTLVPSPDSTSLIIQIVIALATLFKMFRKSKEKTDIR